MHAIFVLDSKAQNLYVGLLLFYVFYFLLFYMFYFMEKCRLCDYANAYPIYDILSLRCSVGRVSKNAVESFRDNGPHANPSKIQFMIISHSPANTSSAMFLSDDNIVSKPGSQIRVL